MPHSDPALPAGADARAAERRCRALIEACAPLVWVTTATGTVVEDLPSWRAFTGQSYQQILGFGWLDCLHPDDRERTLAIWQRSLAGAKPHEQTFRVRSVDGTYRALRACAVPVKNEQGKVVEWVGTCTPLPEAPPPAAPDSAEESRERLEHQQQAWGRLQMIADTAPVYIANMDCQRRFRFVNRPYAARFGLTPEQVVGKHIREVLGASAYDRITPYIERALAGHSVQFELEIHYQGLGRRQIHCCYAPEFDAQSHVVGWIAAVTDITERRSTEDALRTSEYRLRLLTDAMPALIAYVDRDQRYIFNNKVYGEWFGVLAGQLLGKHLREVLGEEVYQHRLPFIREALRGNTVHFEGPTPHVKLGMRQTEASYVPEVDAGGEVRGFYVLARDITERKRAEVELRCARDAAEQANRLKDQFLAVLSHELRTPLTPVVMTVAALEAEPSLPPHVREDLAMIRRNIALETRLIDDLLDLSRIVNGKMSLHTQEVSVHSLLKSAAEMMTSQLRGKRLELDWDLRGADERVRADSARLQQVFWNLLTNAIKFTPEGGSIQIRSWNPSARRLCVQVQDSGIGIDPELIPRIFNAFEQGQMGMTRQFGGLGLGLAISRAIVDLHGGSIRAESDGPGQGTRMIVDLPTIGVIERLTHRIPPAGGGRMDRRLRVLLVEDHPDTLRTLRRLLEVTGYEVEAAGSVSSALELVQSQSFDLLVSDIGLPDGTGIELVRTLRDQSIQIPGIALTGYGMDQDVQCSLNAGFAAHLTKPVDFDALAATMRRILQTATPA